MSHKRNAALTTMWIEFDALEKEIRCPICLSVCENIISLPCHHFFCEVCLNGFNIQQANPESSQSSQEPQNHRRRKKRKKSAANSRMCPICKAEYKRRNVDLDPTLNSLSSYYNKLKKELPRAQTQDIIQRFELEISRPLNRSSSKVCTKSSPISSSSSSSACEAKGRPKTSLRVTRSQGKANTLRHQNENENGSNKRKLRKNPVKHVKKAVFLGGGSKKGGEEASSNVSLSKMRSSLRNRGLPVPFVESQVFDLEGDGRCRTESEQINTGEGDDLPRVFETQIQVFNETSGSEDDDTNDASSRIGGKKHPPEKCKKAASSIGAEGRCTICWKTTPYEDDPILSCQRCGMVAHQACYGVSDEDASGGWQCERCTAFPMGDEKGYDASFDCCVCPNREDVALKLTRSGEWIHVSCAYWHTGPLFGDTERLTDIHHVNDIEPDRGDLVCAFCNEQGACLQCCFGRCAVSYHVPCGFQNGIKFELRDSGKGDDVYFHSFCHKHQKHSKKVISNNSTTAPGIIGTSSSIIHSDCSEKTKKSHTIGKSTRRSRHHHRNDNAPTAKAAASYCSNSKARGSSHRSSSCIGSSRKKKKMMVTRKTTPSRSSKQQKKGKIGHSINGVGTTLATAFGKKKLNQQQWGIITSSTEGGGKVVACTGLDLDMKEKVARACKSFGMELAKENKHGILPEHVTHIVTSTRLQEHRKIVDKRTMKYFQGLILGASIISFEWIEDSLKHQRMMRERPYLAAGDSFGLGASRKRQPRTNDIKIFEDYIVVFLGNFNDSTLQPLLRIIQIAGVKSIFSRWCLFFSRMFILLTKSLLLSVLISYFG